MNVEMLADHPHPASGHYHRGEVYQVLDRIAVCWVVAGIARETDREPPHVDRLLARLDDGAGRACLFLPFLGEFGHLLMSHCRIVHWHRAREKVVCCRPGEDVLFPSASAFVTDWTDPLEDLTRVATVRHVWPKWQELRDRYPLLHPVAAGGLMPAQELHCLHPGEPIPFRPLLRGLRADVVLGARRRDFCPERNWPHWQTLANALTAAGLTFAVIGARPWTYDLAGQRHHSSDLDTSAAVELLQNCRLYVGTDSGCSHLAASVGCDMLVFREEAGGSRNLIGRMRDANRATRLEELEGCWDRPRDVIACVLEKLGAGVEI